MSDRTGMNIGEGIAPPPSGEVGLRNQLRARWRKQPLAVHAGVSIALFLILAGALWSLDHSLSYAVLTIGALYWIHRLPPLPYKLAAQRSCICTHSPSLGIAVSSASSSSSRP